MASNILTPHVNSDSNIKRKNTESDLEVSAEKRNKVDEDSEKFCQSVAEVKADSKLGVLTSWKEPPLIQVSESCTSSIVFFDLETTSLKLDCDITQISAVHNEEIFNTYVIPEKFIHPMASKITGMTFDGQVLHLHNKPVQAVTRKVALENFLTWIKARSPVLMLAHNARFDYTRLFHALQTEGLMDLFSDHIKGFVDTLTIFREKFPNLGDYKQVTLAENILKKSYSSHNSVEDVKILQELYIKSQPHALHSHSCTFISSFNKWYFKQREWKNKYSFSKMIRDGTLTQSTATRLARSGLCRGDLEKVCKKFGETALLSLLKEKDDSDIPRIPDAEIIVEKITKHFLSNKVLK